MVSHRLTLDYDLHPGWLAHFVEGLVAGRAMARACTACARTSFPPQRTCDCGETSADWVALSGLAEVRYRTRGADGDFGLVAFEGADTLAVVALDGLSDGAKTGHILASGGPLARMAVGDLENRAAP